VEPVVLRTARLELSAPTAADAEAIAEAAQDPDIRRYTRLPWPYEVSHAVEFAKIARRGWTEGTEPTWAIRAPELAGMIGLNRIDGGAAEIGYWLAASARRRGYATEAARAVVDWGLDPDGLGLQRIEWLAIVGNTASAAVARGLGFRYEGLLRGGVETPRGRHDGWIAGLLAGDARTAQPWPALG